MKGRLLMRPETDAAVKKYLNFLTQNKQIAAGLYEDFYTEWELMFYVFTAIFSYPIKKALSIVDDFRCNIILHCIKE